MDISVSVALYSSDATIKLISALKWCYIVVYCESDIKLQPANHIL